MPIDILMPALSPTMEKGNLVQWLKAVGDKVRSGDILAEIETDKATMEIEAVADGVLSRILVPKGAQDVPVNKIIGSISTDDDSGAALAPVAAAPPLSAPAPAAARSPEEANGHDTGRLFASPIARRLMAEAAIEASGLAGTGPHGRILERDVNAAVIARDLAAKAVEPAPVAAAPATPAAAPTPSPGDDSHIKALFGAGSFDEVARELDAARHRAAIVQVKAYGSAFLPVGRLYA